VKAMSLLSLAMRFMLSTEAEVDSAVASTPSMFCVIWSAKAPQ
jgi:hypothetical protein